MPPLRALLPLSFGLALGACFRPPTADVLFSCDPVEAPQCPPGYTCAGDGCCHRDGTDPEQNAGACRVLDTGSGTATSASSGTGTAGTGTSGTGTSGTGTSGTGTSGGTSTTGTSGTGASSTDTGTGTSTGGG